MQNLMLITKMTLASWFWHPGRRRRHLQIGKLEFCTFATSPLAQLACLGLSEFLSGRPVEPAGRSQRCKTPICKCLVCLPGAPKPKRRAIFGFSGSSLKVRWQNPKIEFLGKYYTKIARVPNLLLYTPPTLVQPKFRGALEAF